MKMVNARNKRQRRTILPMAMNLPQIVNGIYDAGQSRRHFTVGIKSFGTVYCFPGWKAFRIPVLIHRTIAEDEKPVIC